MSLPKISHFGKLELEEKETYLNGVLYEHWHDSIDNEHHIHLPDGMTFIFEHEEGEGSIKVYRSDK